MNDIFDIKLPSKYPKDFQRLPKIYFTCHPNDFNRLFGEQTCFEKICNDIFKTNEATVYYTKDMTIKISEDNYEVDLIRMNFFVIPITKSVLTEPNRALDSDIKFAKEKRIPILPLMMEQNLEQLYSANPILGKIQYIDVFSKDETKISYEQLLKMHLSSLIYSDSFYDNIKNAFYSTIFLSYRKKDRKYANELMKMIHSNPKLQSIAIWYDEFLTPGEDFNNNIQRALKTCQAFILLITPSLLELPNGKPNYIMEHEYPYARKNQKVIFPIEVININKLKLKKHFKELPKPYRFNSEKDNKRFAKDITSVIPIKAYYTPERKTYLGLAYLRGINCETNLELGFRFVYESAKEGYYKAMYFLGDCYKNGLGTEANEEMGAYWYEKAVKATESTEHYRPTLYMVGWPLAYYYESIGDYQSAFYWYEKSANVGFKLSMLKIAECYENGKGVEIDVKKALDWYEKAAINQVDYACNYLIRLIIHKGNELKLTKEQQQHYFDLYENFIVGNNSDKMSHLKFGLGWCYEYGFITDENSKKAFCYYKESAEEENDENGMWFLAWCYENGYGTPKNLELAEFWHKKSNFDDHPNMFYLINIGNEYIDNKNELFYGLINAERDEVKELALFKRKALLKKDSFAMFRLGLACLRKDDNKSFEWFKMSAENGYSPAHYMLGLFYEGGKAEKIDLAKAYNHYLKAANDGNKDAQRKIVSFYENGIYIEQSKEKAKEYKKKWDLD